LTSAGGDVVTLLFTDLVGSTDLLDRLGDDAADRLRCEHFTLLRDALAGSAGREVKNLGDGLMASFASPLDALRGAVAIQRAFHVRNNRTPGPILAVRIGLHAGIPVADEDDFFGRAVVVASRLCGQARGGQILASELVRDLVGSRGDFRFIPVGRLALKGLTDPVATVELQWAEASQPTGGRFGVGSERPAVGPRRRLVAPSGPRLVGREHELGQLDGELAHVEREGARCVLVSGEAGMGKTRLAAELIARHADRVLGLTARAYPLGHTDAFGLWAEALERHLQAFDPAEVAQLCGGYLDDLATLSHSVAAVRGTAPDREPPRVRVLEGIARVLGALAEKGPVVVVLDDIHLADASSWEALQYVIRNLDEHALLVVATARPLELSEHPVGSEVVLGLEQEHLLCRLNVGPLDTDGLASLVEEIVGEPAGPALIEWVTSRSQGSPLFAGGLVRALLEEGADLRDPRLERLPETLAERVTARLRLLGNEARETLEVLALVGRPVDWADLVTLTERAPTELETQLLALTRVRLVREVERGHELTYEITHPLIHEAIYEALGGLRRRQLHRLTGRVLLAKGRLGEAAPHFARAASVGDPEAVEALIGALRQTEQRQAHREGLGILGSLVELLPSDDGRWLEVADALSRQASWVYRSGLDPDIAVKAMRAIDAALSGDDDTGRRGEVTFRLANFLAWGTGELEEAEHSCERAIELFRAAGEDRKVLLAANELAAIRGLRGDIDGWRVMAEAAWQRAQEVGDAPIVVQSLGNVMLAAYHQGDFDVATPAARQVCDMVRADAKPHRLSLSLVNLGAVLAAEGEIDEARRLLAEAKAVNPAYRESQVLQYEVHIEFFAGNYGGSVAAARDIYGRSSSRVSLRGGFALAYAALSATEAGLLEEAARYLAAAPPAYEAHDYFVFVDYCRWAQGLLLSRHDPAAGHRRLAQAAGQLRTKGAHYWAAAAFSDLVDVASAAGDVDAARRAADDLAGLTAAINRPLYFGLASLGLAQAALAGGDRSGAVEAATEAVTLLAPTGWRAHLGRAHQTLGLGLRPSDRAAAAEHLGQALALFEEGQAVWRRDQCLAALRGLGARAERVATAVSGPSSLTRREHEVARLAGQGLTAPEIAKELFISERTVEGHLAKVYAKLGVESKLELVRRAGEFGL